MKFASKLPTKRHQDYSQNRLFRAFKKCYSGEKWHYSLKSSKFGNQELHRSGMKVYLFLMDVSHSSIAKTSFCFIYFEAPRYTYYTYVYMRDNYYAQCKQTNIAISAYWCLQYFVWWPSAIHSYKRGVDHWRQTQDHRKICDRTQVLSC